MPTPSSIHERVRSNAVSPIAMPEVVIRRFAFKKKLQLAQARIIFSELERFLDEASVAASTPGSEVDEAWHEFILHTRDYMSYCNSRYGQFIHHVPTSPILHGEAICADSCSSQSPCSGIAEEYEACTTECRS